MKHHKFNGMNPIESFEERAAIFETGREGYRRGRRGIGKMYVLWFIVGSVVGAIAMGSYMVKHPYTIKEIRCENERIALEDKVAALRRQRDGLMLMSAEKKAVEVEIAAKKVQ